MSTANQTLSAQILENREVARGSRWLKLALEGDTALDHQPGTVVGLAFEHEGQRYRHAYTVSRADAAKRTLEFLYRVIPEGRMTPVMQSLGPGQALRLAGRGGHPIVGEVDTDPQGIALVSTGTGIGPLYGYAQAALEGGLKLPLKLFAGFREAADCCLQAELKALADRHENFEWHFSLSQPDAAWTGLRGRLTRSMPPLLGPVRGLHFHLVGNGNMVVELYKALILRGLEDRRLTSEIYFNYAEDLEPHSLQALADSFEF